MNTRQPLNAMRNRPRFPTLLLCLCTALACRSATAGGDWFISGYVGQYSDNELWKIALTGRTRLVHSYVYVASVGKELGPFSRHIDMEWEGQIAKHRGEQENYEVNAAFTLRWQDFPWDRSLDTSLAFGNGLSYASEKPFLEEKENDENETSNLLYYILVEAAFARPGDPHWEFFLRTHHRSSVFRLINGVDAGSNFVGGGVRYRFR